VNNRNKDNFHVRHGSSIFAMSVDELRRQFLHTATQKNEIKLFRQDRIGLIIANETAGIMNEGAKLLVHIIPAWSLDDGNTIDIKQLLSDQYNSMKRPIFSGDSWAHRFNADGYCTLFYNNANQINSYFQIFRNGIIEAVELRLLERIQRSSEYDYNWFSCEKAIYEALVCYSNLLRQFDVPKPWFIYVSVLQAKEFKLYNHYSRGEPLGRDVIHSSIGIWEDDAEELDVIIRHTFDSLANCFGYSSSNSFDDDRKYKFAGKALL